MTLSDWIATGGAIGEFLVAFVIYYEWEGQRLDKFLEDAEANSEKRKDILLAYCGLDNSSPNPRNERFKEMLEQENHSRLRDKCDDNIRLFSRIGARLPWFPCLRKIALDWHVVVFFWEIVGPYVRSRRKAAGPSFAETFLRYASESTEHLLAQDRHEWTILDPNRPRKNDIIITRDRLLQIQQELRECLEQH